jgi:hypothetical protein
LTVALLLVAGSAAPLCLAQTATIEGTVTENGSATPVAGATVAVSDPATSFGFPQWTGTTDPSGAYSITVTGLGTGETRDLVVEAASPDHAPGRHGFSGSLPCYFGCGPGGEISVTEGNIVSGIDLALDIGARFSGTVSNATTNAPIDGARIEIVKDQGSRYSASFVGVSQPTGYYESGLAVSAAETHYALATGGSANFATQAYDGFPCEFSVCPLANSDPVPLTSGSVSTGVDFALQPGASLSGELLPDSIPKQIALYNGAGQRLAVDFITSGMLPAATWSFDGLAGGSYYVQLGPLSSVGTPYLRILHNGLLCPFSGCNRARGTPLSIPPGSSLSLAPVTLAEGGRVEGQLIDTGTGTPPSGVPAGAALGTYDIIDASGEVVGGGVISESGGSILLEPSAAVPAGDYYVRTYSQFFADGLGYTDVGSDQALDGYMDAIYPGIPCAGIDCDLSAATQITVTTGGTTSITIEVDTGSSIDGRIVDSVTNAPLPDTPVKLVNAANEQLAAVMADANGEFTLGAFPAGTYYLRTSMGGHVGPGVGPVQNAYFDKVYGATGNCSEALCDPTSGTPIVLDGSTDVSLGDISAESGPVISGQIVSATSGAVIPRGQVEVFTSGGDFVGSFKVGFGDARYQTTALPPGTYTLVPVVSPAYSSVTTSGPTTPTARGSAPSDDGFEVTLGTEDVEADLQVVDQAIDRVFRDDFTAPAE